MNSSRTIFTGNTVFTKNTIFSGFFDSARTLLQALALVTLGTLLLACGQGNEDIFVEAVEVSQQNISSITVTSNDDNQRVRVGETQSFTATANVNGGGTLDVTDKVRWVSSDTAVVTVDEAGVATGVSDGTVDITVRYSDLSASTTLKSSSASIESISVTNPNSSLSRCDTADLPLQALATYSDGDTDDVSDKVTWTSGSSGIIYVGNEGSSGTSSDSRNAKGKISAMSTGSSVITATQDDVVGDLTVTVTDDDIDQDSLKITAPEALYTQQSYRFTASATFGGNTEDVRDITDNLTWVSGTPAVLAFAEQANPAEALAAGSDVDVTASCGDESDQVSVDVQVLEVVGLVVEYDGTYITDNGQLEVSLNDSRMELALFLLYNDGSYGDVDLAEDDDTTWENLDESDDPDNGVINIEEVGTTEYEARYVIENQTRSIEFYVKVVE